jgi:hypothetical protein
MLHLVTAGVVDLSPIIQFFNTTIAAIAYDVVIPGIVMWAGYEAHQRLPKVLAAQFDSQMQASLNTALQNGVRGGLTYLSAWEAAHKDVAVQGAVQRWAVQYAVNHAPDAIRHFGLSEEQLTNKALSFFPPPPSITADSTGVVFKEPTIEVKKLP